MDPLSKEQRSSAMRKVGTKSTPIERIVRKEVKKLKYNFTINSKLLPGKPDIVLNPLHKVIFVNGCFWHFHHCKKLPKSNKTFWKVKLFNNKKRDRKVIRELQKLGWEILVVWECWKKRPDYLRKKLSTFLKK